MIFTLPVDLKTLNRVAEDAIAKHQPGRQYEIEFVVLPRKRELSINVRSKGDWSATGRFRYQLLPFAKF